MSMIFSKPQASSSWMENTETKAWQLECLRYCLIPSVLPITICWFSSLIDIPAADSWRWIILYVPEPSSRTTNFNVFSCSFVIDSGESFLAEVTRTISSLKKGM